MAGSTPVFALALCEVRLQRDARFPWIVLIPRRNDARELEDLSVEDRVEVMDEIILAGEAVRALGASAGRPVEKLNVGALGNIVPQLHVHVVGRRADDAAWPGPVWGAGDALPYADGMLEQAISVARGVLAARSR